MKEFILEIGKDFLFIDEEHEFRPTYKGQLGNQPTPSRMQSEACFVIAEARRRKTIVNRTMSPMMVMQYEEQLKVGGVIQRSLEEYCRFVSEAE